MAKKNLSECSAAASDVSAIDDLIDSYKSKEDPSEIKSWLSTGSTLLDYAISNRRDGGIPFGRITEINGLEGSGKSLLSVHLAASIQKQGGVAFLLDTEGRNLNKDFQIRAGCDPRKFIARHPGTIEGCFSEIESIIAKTKTKAFAKFPILIVWDSVAATPPKAEIEGDFDPNSQIGIGAKAMARGLRKLVYSIGVESIALVCIQQLRVNMKATPYTPAEQQFLTPYGKSLPYFASVRIRLAQGEKIWNDATKTIRLGTKTRAVVEKNSAGVPYRSAEFPILFSQGVDDDQSIYTFLHSSKVLTKQSGESSLELDGTSHSFPHENWKEFLSANRPAILDLLEKMLIVKYDKVEPAA